MALPADAQAIYDRLIADPVLAALVGQFLRPDGQQPLTAISVMEIGERLPESWEPSGLELRIIRTPSYPRAMPLLGDEVMLRPVFRIHLTQWSLSSAGNYVLQAAVQRVLVLLPGATAADVGIEAGVTGLAQSVIRWMNPEVYATPAVPPEPEPEPEPDPGEG